MNFFICVRINEIILFDPIPLRNCSGKSISMSTNCRQKTTCLFFESLVGGCGHDHKIVALKSFFCGKFSAHPALSVRPTVNVAVY